MMYKGSWLLEHNYFKGDVVFYNRSYYVCNENHMSSPLVAPNDEDVYWILFDDVYLRSIHKNAALATQKPLAYRGTYSTQRVYYLGDIVRFNACVYICSKKTTEGQISLDEGSWQKLDDSTLDYLNSFMSLSTKLTTTAMSSVSVNVPNVAQMDDAAESFHEKRLKRKLEKIEHEIERHNKKAKTQNQSIRERLLLLDIDIPTKAYIVNKYDEQISKMSSGDKAKGMAWVNTLCSVPFGVYKSFPVKRTDSPAKIKAFFDTVLSKLDKAVHGHRAVKEEIMEFVAKCISNKHAKGQILALCGPKGVAKTRLMKKGLAEALGFPFFQINFGGLNDANILTGHDMTYVGSKPGKIVEILSKAKCMNPIIYLDEIDKIGETKAREIFGVLTHLLDQEQHHEFHDNYLSDVKLDLSKCLFVISFNDICKVDHIVSDRMKVIYIDPPSVDDKVHIAMNILLPEICKDAGVEWVAGREASKGKGAGTGSREAVLGVQCNESTLAYIIRNKVAPEEGVRQLKKVLETIVNRLNLDFIVDKKEFIKVRGSTFTVDTSVVNRIIQKPLNTLDEHVLHAMYT